MIVQALWDIRSPLLQLPHVTEDMQKYFMSRKRQIRTIQQFCQLKEDDRRVLLKALNDNQYQDVLRVCSSMPLIDFKVQCEGKKSIQVQQTREGELNLLLTSKSKLTSKSYEPSEHSTVL